MYDLQNEIFSNMLCSKRKEQLIKLLKNNNKNWKSIIDLHKINITTKRNVVIAMASFPARKQSMIKVISQLYFQCNKIYIWLNEYTTIPSELKQYPNVIAILAKKHSDCKENGRLFWVNQHANDYYLTVDDDINYPPNYVNNIIMHINALHENVIVSYHGTIFDNKNKEHYFSFTHNVDSIVQVHRIGGGVAGMIPKKINFICPDIDKLKTWDGDATISVWATNNNIKKYVLPHSSLWLTPIQINHKKMNLVNALCLSKNTKQKRQQIYNTLTNGWEILLNEYVK